MSEELISKGLDERGVEIGSYEYYDTNRTNLNTFKTFGVVAEKNYGRYGKREPDGLLVDRADRTNLRVIAVVEFKSPKEFNSERLRKKALEQCNDVCQVLGATFGVVSDRNGYIWINPHQSDKKNNYIDVTTGAKRSYSLIRNEDKKYLSEPFIIQTQPEKDVAQLDEATKNSLYYVQRILECISASNSTLKATEEVDPLRLAQAVWQDIYINTAKTPIKCLYNVVELFIFKFLSDLEVLKKPEDFDFVLALAQEKGAKEALRYYAKNSRPKIKELFPAGDDKTTIINGTIFVDKDGDPVESQANLFTNSLKRYKDFGSLRNVKKEFKTKLFETFLKQSSDKSKLGQFFTPRKVVRAIVDMADVENLRPGARVCDPFCGVGGFIAESIQKPKRRADFFPKANGTIEPKVKYFGYDKGTDEDDERVIILAKANLLIYLSDIIERYPTYTKKFAKVLNEIFHFLTESNLGTLRVIVKQEDERFDLILTNPPYITSGVTSIKNEIVSDALTKYYNVSSKGVDGLALQWIIRSLRRGGKAIVIVSNGILESGQNKGLREHLLKECHLNGIVSLPIKTFFNTPQKTFILLLTKKENEKDHQSTPVFTYLVSNIGETLDINRFETEGKSDLERAKELYNLFKGAPSTFPVKEIADARCKVQPIQKFLKSTNWNVDRWWSESEQIKLGVQESKNVLDVDEYIKTVSEKKDLMEESLHKLQGLKQQDDGRIKINRIAIGTLFRVSKGYAKYTKKYIRNHPGVHPVYSSQTINDGIIGRIASFDLDGEAITWTTDGIYAGTPFLRNGKFSMTTHCGALFLKEEYVGKVDLGYVFHYMKRHLRRKAVGEGNKRLTVELISPVTIEIPVNKKGELDIKKQKEVSARLDEIEQVRTDLNGALAELQEVELDV